MPSELNETIKIKVFQKGQVVIPVSLRKRYNIDIGDHIQAIPSKDGIFLKAPLKTKEPATISDTLFGIFSKYARKKQEIIKKEIEEATENGFIEGWKE